MSFKSRWQETRRGGAAAAAFATLLGLVLLIFGEGLGLSRLSYDLPFALRPDLKPDEAVIIYMDEDSHRALHQDFFSGWNRTLHARLLDRLKACSVKAVAFDILFDTVTTNDAAFVKAVQNQGRVVLGARFAPVGLSGISFFQTILPIDELQRVAAWGLTEVPDVDLVVRQHQRNDRHSTNLISMAWRLTAMTSAAALPDPGSPRWLNYYGPPGIIPWVSYVQVLSNNVPLSALSNKVVFVGALIHTGFTGGTGTDDYSTPYSRWTGTKSPGVEINATAYLNLIRREWLTRLSPMREFLLVLATGILFGFGLNFCRPVPVAAITVTAMLLVFGVACALMWRQQLWFPWAILGGVQIPCAGICAVLFGAQKVHRQKQALEDELATRGASATRSPSATAALFHQGSPTPSKEVRQQMRDHFNTPSPVALSPDAPTVVSAPDAPVIADCVLLRRIGAGAYGEVWLGSTVLGAYRAIKIVYRKSFHDDRPYEREFDGIKNFDPISRNHPGLVSLLHVGRNDVDGYFYYLMELADDCAGAQLSDAQKYDPKTLGKELKRRGRLPVSECIQIGLALTDSLSYLHEHGLIHRDIKPANIIFVDGKAKLADIGLVTQIGDGQTFVGTEGFYPPEGPGSPGGDIYSLGKVLYEAFTGLNRQSFPDLPTGMDLQEDAERFKQFNKIILRACETNVRKRYTTARQMYEDLQQFTDKRRRLLDFFKKRPSRDVKRATSGP